MADLEREGSGLNPKAKQDINEVLDTALGQTGPDDRYGRISWPRSFGDDPKVLTEPTTPEGQKIRQAHQTIAESLAFLNITINENGYNYGKGFDAPFHFFGLDGSFQIIVYPPDNPSLPFEIRRDYNDPRRKRMINETFYMRADGQGSYTRDEYSFPREFRNYGEPERRWYKHEEGDTRKKPELVARKLGELAFSLKKSITSNETTPEEFAGGLQKTYAALMNYFASKGIVPKMDLLPYVESNLEEYFSGEYREIVREFKRRNPPVKNYEVGHVYRDVQLPGITGFWHIRFDDARDKTERIYGGCSRFAEARGMGIMLTHRKTYFDDTVDLYALWQNGDASYSRRGPGTYYFHDRGNSHINTSGSTADPRSRFFNPHLVVMKLEELEDVLTGSVNSAPSKKSLFEKYFDLDFS